jgi:hypothetical protein
MLTSPNARNTESQRTYDKPNTHHMHTRAYPSTDHISSGPSEYEPNPDKVGAQAAAGLSPGENDRHAARRHYNRSNIDFGCTPLLILQTD